MVASLTLYHIRPTVLPCTLSPTAPTRKLNNSPLRRVPWEWLGRPTPLACQACPSSQAIHCMTCTTIKPCTCSNWLHTRPQLTCSSSSPLQLGLEWIPDWWPLARPANPSPLSLHRSSNRLLNTPHTLPQALTASPELHRSLMSPMNQLLTGTSRPRRPSRHRLRSTRLSSNSIQPLPMTVPLHSVRVGSALQDTVTVVRRQVSDRTAVSRKVAPPVTAVAECS